MKNPTRLLSMTLCFVLGAGFMTTVSARDIERADTVDITEIGFAGTPAELVGYTVNQLLIGRGTAAQPAGTRLAASLQKAFGGSSEFQWANTVVFETANRQAFSLTLPSAFDALTSGRLALGLLEDGVLVRAFSVTMMGNQAGGYDVTLVRADGEMGARVSLGVGPGGEWTLTPQDLLELAVVLYPSAAKGVFDPLIETLEGILDMLYQIKSLINMAICIVNEAIEMFNDLNMCGWGETQVGGGAIAGLIVCTVQDVIEFLSEMTDHCL